MTRPSLNRPTLLPGLPRFWRGATTLQLGLHPAHAIFVELPDRRAERVLDLLDGSRSERGVIQSAESLGVQPRTAGDLLDVLIEAGLVIPAQRFLPSALDAATRRRLVGEAAALALAPPHQPPFQPPPRPSSQPPTQPPTRPPASARLPSQPLPGRRSPGTPGPQRDPGGARPPSRPSAAPALTLRRRRAAKVVISGRGRLAAGIAVALAEAGVGQIHPDLSGTVTDEDRVGSPLRDEDVGADRAAAVAAAITRAVPSTSVQGVRQGAALVVQLIPEEPVALLALKHLQRRQPHLAVSVEEGLALIGPFVPASGRPCMNCVALRRFERARAVFRAQAPELPELTRDDVEPHGRGRDIEPLPVATVLAAVGLATAEALTFIDGRMPESRARELVVMSPGWVRRRTWSPHPHCPCATRHRSAPTNGDE